MHPPATRTDRERALRPDPDETPRICLIVNAPADIGDSVLELRLHGARSEHVLDPRVAIVLRLLNRAWRKDADGPRSLRGLRSKAWIIANYCRLRARDPIDDRTVVKYVGFLRAGVRACVAALEDELDLDLGPLDKDILKSRRNQGYRLTRGIEIRRHVGE